MGVPLKWLVYKGNPIKMDDLGVPPFMETAISHIIMCVCCLVWMHGYASRAINTILRGMNINKSHGHGEIVCAMYGDSDGFRT